MTLSRAHIAHLLTAAALAGAPWAGIAPPPAKPRVIEPRPDALPTRQQRRAAERRAAKVRR